MIYKVSTEKEVVEFANEEEWGESVVHKRVHYVLEENIESITSTGDAQSEEYAVHIKSPQSYSIKNVIEIESV